MREPISGMSFEKYLETDPDLQRRFEEIEKERKEIIAEQQTHSGSVAVEPHTDTHQTYGQKRSAIPDGYFSVEYVIRKKRPNVTQEELQSALDNGGNRILEFYRGLEPLNLGTKGTFYIVIPLREEENFSRIIGSDAVLRRALFGA